MKESTVRLLKSRFGKNIGSRSHTRMRRVAAGHVGITTAAAVEEVDIDVEDTTIATDTITKATAITVDEGLTDIAVDKGDTAGMDGEATRDPLKEGRLLF